MMNNKNESTIIRYWASEMLMAIRIPESYNILKENLFSDDLVVSMLACSTLLKAGFKVKLPDLTKSMEQTDNIAKIIFIHRVLDRFNQSEKIDITERDEVGAKNIEFDFENVPGNPSQKEEIDKTGPPKEILEICVPILNDRDEKLRVTAAKALLTYGSFLGKDILFEGLSSSRDRKSVV